MDFKESTKLKRIRKAAKVYIIKRLLNVEKDSVRALGKEPRVEDDVPAHKSWERSPNTTITQDSGYHSTSGALENTLLGDVEVTDQLESCEQQQYHHSPSVEMTDADPAAGTVFGWCSDWVDRLETMPIQPPLHISSTPNFIDQQINSEKGEASKTSAHTASSHLRKSKSLEENTRQLDGEASPELSYDSGPSESTRAFDLDTWFDSSDEEMDSASHMNLLLPVRSALAVRLLRAYYNCAINSNEDSGSTNSDTSRLSSGSGSSGHPSAKSGKRRSEGHQPLGGKDGPKPSRRRKTNTSATEEKLLACPFCKHEPRKYRDCYRYVMRNISRLKQHLGRYHQIPIHCPSCSTIFDTESQRDEHIRDRSCDVQPPRDWDGITESQKKQLSKRVSTGQTTEQSWYTIYEILFPGSPRPRSPYIDMPLSEELLGLREFAAEQGPSIISDSLEDMPEALRPNEDEVRTFAVTMFQDAIGLLLQRFTENRSALDSTAILQEDTGIHPLTDLPVDPTGDEPPEGLGIVQIVPVGRDVPQAQRETEPTAMDIQQPENAEHDAEQAPPWNRSSNTVPTISDFEFIDPSYLQQLDEAAAHWNPLFQHAFTGDNVA